MNWVGFGFGFGFVFARSAHAETQPRLTIAEAAAADAVTNQKNAEAKSSSRQTKRKKERTLRAVGFAKTRSGQRYFLCVLHCRLGRPQGGVHTTLLKHRMAEKMQEHQVRFNLI